MRGSVRTGVILSNARLRRAVRSLAGWLSEGRPEGLGHHLIWLTVSPVAPLFTAIYLHTVHFYLAAPQIWKDVFVGEAV